MLFEMNFQFCWILTPEGLCREFKILQLIWTIRCVYKDLIWRAELLLCRFLSAKYCCRWLQLVFISGLFFDSDCFFDYTRLWVTSAWSVPTTKVFPTYFRLVWISFSAALAKTL